MQDCTRRFRPGVTIRRSVCSLFVLLFVMVFLPHTASAHTISSSLPTANGPSFRATAGFDTRYRDGNWIPIRVALRNDGPDFNGFVSVNTPLPFAGAGNSGVLSTYRAMVSLPSGAQKQVTLYVPFYYGTQGITQNVTIDLLDTNGHKVNSQASPIHALGPGDIFVGILSDQPTTGFTALNALSLPNPSSSVFTQNLNASTFPTVAEALNNFDLLILDNFTTSNLNKSQLATLQNWVHQGGSLIVVGGPEWMNTLKPLPASLLPATVTQTTTIPSGTSLLPFIGPADPGTKSASTNIQAPVNVSVATPAAGGSVLLSSNGTPLIVQSQLGLGQIDYLAFDPSLEPVVSWSQASSLWRALLLRNLGDQMLISSASSTTPTVSKSVLSSNTNGLGAVLQSLFPTSFLATQFILILLLGYILVLGPIRLLIVRRLKSRDWSWRIVVSTILVFSLLSYGLALQQKGTSILSSNISVVQLDRPSATESMAHTTTYVGVFVPNQGDFRVHLSNDGLVQPANDQQSRSPNGLTSQPTTITTTQSGTDATLQGVNIWTLRTLISRSNHTETGGILSRLSLQDDLLSGTVTNTLHRDFSDAYLLTYGRYVSLGQFKSGTTKEIHLQLPKIVGGQTASFADQIAASKHLAVPYTPISNGNQPQTEQQRHMAMLSALSGEAGYDCSGGSGFCMQYGVVASNGVMVSNGNYSSSAYNQLINGGDPLMLPDASATLIGWADNPSSDTTNVVTINDTYTSKSQETFFQAPLDVTLSGSVNLPPASINSQLVDVQTQGTGVQTLYPGVYALSSGNMTFEFTLPVINNPHIGTLQISTASSLPQVGNTVGQQGSIDANHLHPYLYNWQTRNWDAYAFSSFTFPATPSQSYIGPGGRVLLRLANTDSTQATAIFGKPSLQLVGASNTR
ncbi:hypothetical protein [Reticulibacter mediterranei]|nr:hypothetical protein [Reticulibacter mediterranei]